MERTRQDVKEGLVVRTADGEKLGRIVRCEADSFVIEKGIFFPTDFVARYDDVADVRDGEVQLGRRAADLSDSGSRSSRGATASIPHGATEQVSVPVAEEELSAEKKTKEAGRVHLRKEVHTEQRQISVPVTREEVHVERVPAGNREAGPGDATFQQSDVTIPVREEEVEIRKRPVVREEVRVSKTSREEQRVASAEVRKESAELEEEGDVQHRADGEPNYHS